jgi:hypothetical protein
MGRTQVPETRSPIPWREITISSTLELGEQLLLLLALERRQQAVIYMMKDNTGDVHVSRFPREGPRKIVYKGPR